MNVCHKLWALLLLAVWLPYYSHCIEPHCHFAIAEAAAHHEEDHGSDHHHDHDGPWGECHQHDPASLAQGALKLQPPPVFEVVAEWTAVLLAPPCAQAPPLPPDIAGSGAAPPLQTLLVKTAQPVRGPSA